MSNVICLVAFEWVSKLRALFFEHLRCKDMKRNVYTYFPNQAKAYNIPYHLEQSLHFCRERVFVCVCVCCVGFAQTDVLCEELWEYDVVVMLKMAQAMCVCVNMRVKYEEYMYFVNIKKCFTPSIMYLHM